MEHFLEVIAPLRHWYISPNEKSNKYKSSLLSLLTKALTEHFLQGKVPLRHLLNAKPPFMSWQMFNEVNNWALRKNKYVISSRTFLLILSFLCMDGWTERRFLLPFIYNYGMGHSLKLCVASTRLWHFPRPSEKKSHNVSLAPRDSSRISCLVWYSLTIIQTNQHRPLCWYVVRTIVWL